MNIIIGFSSAKSKYALFGKAIELVEKRPFSHALVIYQDPITGIDMVFQAAHGIVHSCSFSKFCEYNNIIKLYKLEFTQQEYDEFYKMMLTLLGTKYGWCQIIGIFIKKLIHIESPFHNGLQSIICSELAARICKIKNIPITIDLDSITPSDLDKILSEIYK